MTIINFLRKKRLQFKILLLIIVCLPLQIKAQDPHFSQYNHIPLYLNPALAGMGHQFQPRMIMNFRDQWPSIPSNFISYAASFDMYFPNARSGIGILFMGDQAGKGTFNTYTVSASYAFNISFPRKNQLRIALKAGYYYQHLDWDNLHFIDMYDRQLGMVYSSSVTMPENLSTHNFDCGVGILFFRKNFYAGFAVDHLAPVNLGYLGQSYILPVKYTFHTGANFGKGRKRYDDWWKLQFSPYFIVQWQSSFYQFNHGLNILLNPIIVGISMRHTMIDFDAVIFTAGVSFKPVTIRYSFDFTTSKLYPQSGGAHEISIQFDISSDKKCWPCTHYQKYLSNKYPCIDTSPLY